MSNLPDTPGTAQFLQSYLQGVLYSDGITPVYVPVSSQLPSGSVKFGRWKDPSSLLPANGANVIAEIHGDTEKVERYTSGGRMKDYTTFAVLSLTDMSNDSAAWLRLYKVRDAIIVYILKHAQLAGLGNVENVKFVPGGKYWVVDRGKEYLAYLCHIEVLNQWVVAGGFTS